MKLPRPAMPAAQPYSGEGRVPGGSPYLWRRQPGCHGLRRRGRRGEPVEPAETDAVCGEEKCPEGMHLAEAAETKADMA